jgi:hypothetical protein
MRSVEIAVQFTRPVLVVALAAAMLLLLPLAAQAQRDVELMTGFALGVIALPERTVNTCGGNVATFPGVELTAGVALRNWRLGARAQGFSSLGVNDCGAIDQPSHWDGVHTDRIYGFDRAHGGGSAAALFAHYLQPGGHWSVGAGFGRISPDKRFFIETSGAVRTGGRVALVLRADQRWVYLPYDVLTAEWEQGEMVCEISRESGSTWPRAHSVMLGLDVRFR